MKHARENPLKRGIYMFPNNNPVKRILKKISLTNYKIKSVALEKIGQYNSTLIGLIDPGSRVRTKVAQNQLFSLPHFTKLVL